MDAAALCKLIDQAFAPMPYPGDNHIVYDNTGRHLECAAIKKALKGREWRSISFDELLDLRSALSFSSLEGFRYYLPAYMIFTVADFSGADTISDTVMLVLTPPKLEDVLETWEQIEQFAKAWPDVKTLPPELSREIRKQQEEAQRGGEPLRRFNARVAGFTPGQKKAIRSYLEYMRDTYAHEFDFDEPQKALDRYWAQF